MIGDTDMEKSVNIKEVVKYRPLFIGGQWVEASSSETADDINPATGEVNVTYSLGNKKDVEKAVAAAEKAYCDYWYDTTVGERAKFLFQLADMVEQHAEEFAYLGAIEAGKPITVAKNEIPFISDTFRYFAGVARNPEGKATQEYENGVTSMIRREPLGVTAGICPWNYPLLMMAWKLAPALAAGNTSIIKPASDSSLTALYFAELAADILPAGVLNVITGSGAEIGNAICMHPDIRLVSMTGSTETGKHIASASSGTLKRVHLELGGKAPVIVFADADVDTLATGLKEWSFVNSGQDCGQPCRILVATEIYDEVVEKLTNVAEKVIVGDIFDPKTEMGPVISARQCKIIHEIVERAETEGAIIHTGGKKKEGPGAYYLPTVISNVSQKSEIIQREIFGPVITIQEFCDEQQALDMANDVIYGLSASIWTSDLQRALRMIRKLQFGTVWINTHLVQPMEMPWGGYKQSGYGKDMSGYAFEEYTQIKHVGMAF